MTDHEKMQFCMMAAFGIAIIAIVASYSWIGA
jgi:hypothetical protein